MNKKLLVFALSVILVFSFTSCGAQTAPSPSPSPQAVSSITADRMGNPISVPSEIEQIMSIGPANTEILVGLGLGNKIMATDTFSTNVDGIRADIPLFSMMELDTEQMVSLAPDIVVITEMSLAGGEDPLKLVKEAGVCVVYMPTGDSIADIIENIKFLGEVTNTETEAKKIVTDMEESIDKIREAGKKAVEAGEVKKVYFEISPAPDLYSFGSGVFLNEMIEIIGAENILAGENGWMSVTDEAILGADPDVILTNVSYIENAVDEIKARSGWDSLKAVENDDVYLIDADASSRSSHNVIKALEEMAEAIYPENK